MSRVHLCLGRLADNPYTFEKSRVRVFSIEELCFFLRENAYLLDENIFTRGLFDWIGKECALPDLGQKLNMLLKNKEKPESFVTVIFEYTGYFDDREIRETQHLVEEIGRAHV